MGTANETFMSKSKPANGHNLRTQAALAMIDAVDRACESIATRAARPLAPPRKVVHDGDGSGS